VGPRIINKFAKSEDISHERIWKLEKSLCGLS